MWSMIPLPKRAVTKNLVRGQKRSGGDHFGCQKLSARTGNVSTIGPSVAKVVLWGTRISIKCTTKMPPSKLKDGYGCHGLIQQRSRRPAGGGLPVYDTKALHLSPQMHGRMKDKHKVKSNQVCFFATVSLSFVVVLMFHY